jgi:hypothetical protein
VYSLTNAYHRQTTKVGKYVQEIQAMMYTFGDVRNVVLETAELVEDTLHGQLVDIVRLFTPHGALWARF